MKYFKLFWKNVWPILVVTWFGFATYEVYASGDKLLTVILGAFGAFFYVMSVFYGKVLDNYAKICETYSLICKTWEQSYSDLLKKQEGSW